MTPKYLKQLCKEQKLYQTPELNDRLYLHFKGFVRIESLEPYVGLRALWLEGNGIQKIENLGEEFLQQNCIEQIENLDELVNLDTLNLSNNLIKRIDNLGKLPVLKTLQLAHNFLRNAEDLERLVECPSLTILDLSHNKLDDVNIMEVLKKMPNLAVVNLISNPVTSKIKNYRRTMISQIPTLTYLDDRPVFEKERLAVEAWSRGGYDAEREERARQRDAEAEERRRNFEAMSRLQEANRERRRLTYGEETEVVHEGGLAKLQAEMLAKIEDDSTTPEVAKAAEKTDQDNVRSTPAMDGDEGQPPIRQFAALTTSGEKLEIESQVVGEGASGTQSNDADSTGLQQGTSRPLIEILPDEPSEHNKDETEDENEEAIETVVEVPSVPPLEDASEELAILRERANDLHLHLRQEQQQGRHHQHQEQQQQQDEMESRLFTRIALDDRVDHDSSNMGGQILIEELSDSDQES
ncbi:Dynein assembly factor 1, axonemal [Quaeritorhiza haematococci]|nr:Dynein assembly factor 1, axonemal [Quaeritorhiza haematococci]